MVVFFVNEPFLESRRQMVHLFPGVGAKLNQKPGPFARPRQLVQLLGIDVLHILVAEQLVIERLKADGLPLHDLEDVRARLGQIGVLDHHGHALEQGRGEH